MRRINSRQKGARVEREAAAYLQRLGFACERNGRNGYSTDDLRSDDPVLSRFAIEVKGDASVDVGTKALADAFAQARTNAMGTAELSLGPAGMDLKPTTAERVPVVLWRHNRKAWRLTWMDSCGLATVAGDDAIKAKILQLSGGGA